MASAGLRRWGTRNIPDSLRRATQLQLSNVPNTATPADLRRLIIRAQVQGVKQVAIEYHRLEPTGRAFVQLTNSDLLRPSLEALEKVTIAGVHLYAEPIERPAMSDQANGNGLSSELDSNGKHVVVWGFPKAAAPPVLDQLLEEFTFPPGEPYIFKINDPQHFTVTSRFLVRCGSVADAHRLVRTLHMTLHGPKFPIRARVIY
ncbi:hypothetical protein DFH09DRAFT_646643 [Mycena vulgaris]|nr:hypothetical protein DFH09DRAFT_646643 [Mycena vulgaris]